MRLSCPGLAIEDQEFVIDEFVGMGKGGAYLAEFGVEPVNAVGPPCKWVVSVGRIAILFLMLSIVLEFKIE